MGREIRRVPPGWEHPKDAKGHYEPMLDQTLQNAMADEDFDECWGDSDLETARRYYRPEWTEEPTHYQMYETVSEGTPVSPVFASLDELVGWLIGQGHSRKAAEGFAKHGWAPSMEIVRKGNECMIYMGVDIYDVPAASQP